MDFGSPNPKPKTATYAGRASEDYDTLLVKVSKIWF